MQKPKITKTIRVPLSLAQRAAFEQRDWLIYDEDDAPILAAYFAGDNRRTHIEFPATHADAVISELNELSNFEDAAAEQDRSIGDRESAKYAARAARSFYAIASNVVRRMDHKIREVSR